MNKNYILSPFSGHFDCSAMKYGYFKKHVVPVLGTVTCMMLVCVLIFFFNFCHTSEVPTIHPNRTLAGTIIPFI